MPIYMDRHDVSENVTAENVAQLHQEDLKIQDQFGCRGLTYWFDGKRKTAFCLIEALNAQAIQDMHAKAHGEVPNQIIEVEAGIVESFLGRIEDPEASLISGLNIIDDPAFRTIMMIKLVENKLSDQVPERTESFSKAFTKRVSSIVKNFEGSIVKQAAQYFLVSFKSTAKAVGAAIKLYSHFHHSTDNSNPGCRLQIGLNAGAPFTERESMFADVVKLADRLCDLSLDRIMISSEVKNIYISENNIENGSDELLSSFPHADEKILMSLMDYMEDNYSDANITVHDFTRSLGISKSKLYRKIVFLSGKSLNTFIREYRLDKAMGLLRKNKYSISEIAYDTGFTSPSYFSKCFQKKFGNYPSTLKLS